MSPRRPEPATPPSQRTSQSGSKEAVPRLLPELQPPSCYAPARSLCSSHSRVCASPLTVPTARPCAPDALPWAGGPSLPPLPRPPPPSSAVFIHRGHVCVVHMYILSHVVLIFIFLYFAV